MKCTTSLFAVLFCVAFTSRAFAEEGRDVLINNFEGSDWGDWRTEDEAFGPRPAQGAWEKQGVVSEFDGKGLANSCCRGDAATGKLISPEFTVSRKYLVFRAGGSDRPFNFTAEPDYVAVQLVHQGPIIRNSSTRMMKVKQGVSDTLRTDYFDVSDYLGEKVHLEIVDARPCRLTVCRPRFTVTGPGAMRSAATWSIGKSCRSASGPTATGPNGPAQPSPTRTTPRV
jgi:hypothetical protein